MRPLVLLCEFGCERECVIVCCCYAFYIQPSVGFACGCLCLINNNKQLADEKTCLRVGRMSCRASECGKSNVPG